MGIRLVWDEVEKRWKTVDPPVNSKFENADPGRTRPLTEKEYERLAYSAFAGNPQAAAEMAKPLGDYLQRYGALVDRSVVPKPAPIQPVGPVTQNWWEQKRVNQEEKQSWNDYIQRLTDQYMPIRPNPIPQVDINKKYGPSSGGGGARELDPAMRRASGGMTDFSFGGARENNPPNGWDYDARKAQDIRRVEQEDELANKYQLPSNGRKADNGWDYDARKAQDIRRVEQEDELANKYQLPSNGRKADTQITPQVETAGQTIEELTARRAEVQKDLATYDTVLKWPVGRQDVEGQRNFTNAQVQRSQAQKELGSLNEQIRLKEKEQRSAEDAAQVEALKSKYEAAPDWQKGFVLAELKAAEYNRDWNAMTPLEQTGVWLVDRAKKALYTINDAVYAIPDLIADVAGVDRLQWSKNNKAALKGVQANIEQQAKNTGWMINAAGDVVSEGIRMIPTILIASMTGGASLAAQGAANIATAGAGTGARVAQATVDMLKNPSFVNSFFTMFGLNLSQAREAGIDPATAVSMSWQKALPSALIEMSGGYQKAAERGRGWLDWLIGSLEEGGEEVFQGITDTAVEKTFGNVFNLSVDDVISLTNQEAIVSGARAAEEFGLGAVTAGVMGGAQIGLLKGMDAITGNDPRRSETFPEQINAYGGKMLPADTAGTKSYIKPAPVTQAETTVAEAIAIAGEISPEFQKEIQKDLRGEVTQEKLVSAAAKISEAMSKGETRAEETMIEPPSIADKADTAIEGMKDLSAELDESKAAVDALQKQIDEWKAKQAAPVEMPADVTAENWDEYRKQQEADIQAEYDANMAAAQERYNQAAQRKAESTMVDPAVEKEAAKPQDIVKPVDPALTERFTAFYEGQVKPLVTEMGQAEKAARETKTFTVGSRQASYRSVIPAKAAPTIEEHRAKNPDIDNESFDYAAEAAYVAGLTGSQAAFDNSAAVKDLAPETAKALFDMGMEEFGENKVIQRAARGKLAYIMPKPGQGKLNVPDAVRKKMNSEQKKLALTLQKVITMMGVEADLFISDKVENGLVVGEEGSFDPATGRFRFDINAGINFVKDLQNKDRGAVEFALPRVMGHEFTHYLKLMSPELFAQYQEAMIRELVKNNSLDDLVLQEMARGRKGDLTYDTALEEVIARSSEMMLRDTQFMQNVMGENPTLREKFKAWVADFVKGIQERMKGMNPAYPAAKTLMETANGVVKYTGTLQAIWDKAMAQSITDRAKAPPAPPAVRPAAAVVDEAVDMTKDKAKPAPLPESLKTGLNEGVSYTADNTPIRFRYKVVNIKNLITSHDDNFAINPAFPEELQPRDRERSGLKDQVAEIARTLNPARLGESAEVTGGAPVIGADMNVEVGNGRVIALRTAMARYKDNARAYTQWLKDNAASFGLKPSDITANSVLVRERIDEPGFDRATYTQKANVPTTATGSETENAAMDADKITSDMLAAAELRGGELNMAGDSRFVVKFINKIIPLNERNSFIDKNGNLSQRGETRIRNALFQLAYGDETMTAQLAEVTEGEVRNVIKAMTNIAPRLAQMNADVEAGRLHPIVPTMEIVQAYQAYKNLKQNGGDVVAYLKQVPMIEMDKDAAKALVAMFEANKNAPNRMTDNMNAILDAAVAMGNPDQITMPGMEGLDATKLSVVNDGIARAGGEQVRFSLRGPMEAVGNLVAVHNLSESQLQETVRLGGFAMPSIAVMKAGTEHSRYGDISVVFGRETIDPARDSRNKIYGGDAYTPSFPQINYEISEDSTAAIRKKVSGLLGELYKPFDIQISNDSIERAADNNRGSFADAYENEPGLMGAYLKSIGEDFIPYSSEPEYAPWSGIGNQTIKYLADKMGKELQAAYNKPFDEKMAMEPAIRGVINEYFEREYSNTLSKKQIREMGAEEYGFNKIDEIIRGVGEYLKTKGAVRFDKYETGKMLRDRFKEGDHLPGYRAWLNELFAGAIAKSGIRNNADIFTPSGNRRSFDATHWQVTLDNIVRAMKAENSKGADGWASSNLFGVATKNFKSIADVRRDADRLRQMDDEAYKAEKDEFQQRLIELASEIVTKKEPNRFIAIDHAAEALTDAARAGTKAGMQRILNEYRDYHNIKADTAEKLDALVKDIMKMPTEYFEAKPERAVGLEEMRAVIHPNTTSKSLIDWMERKGVRRLEYEAGNEQDRLDKLNSIEDVRFSERPLAPVLYSKMQQEIEGIKGSKMGAESIIPYLRGKGVKADEIRWSGIQTFLQGKKSVSKEELLEFAKGNELRVEDVTLDSLGGYSEEEFERLQQEEEYVPEKNELDQTKFGPDKNYALHGGTNYREVLFTAPDLDGSFQSEHWYENNVLAHARMQDFQTNKGEPVLFVEEVQSDWHEKGRELGYKEPDSIEAATLVGKIAELKKKREPVRAEHRKIADEYDNLTDKAYATNDTTIIEKYKSLRNRMNALWVERLRLSEEIKALEKELRYINLNNDNAMKVSPAPFADTWHEYVLKRVLRMAAEGDYDYVAWTTGEMQIDRYSLEKVVREIHAWKHGEGTFTIDTIDLNGDSIKKASGMQMDEKKIIGLFGKEIGGRLINNANSTPEGFTLKGEGLKIGGAGMRNFYDIGGKSEQNIPRFLNKYAGQWGAKVQTIQMDKYTVPAVEVTEKMRDSVLYEGQPMYSERDSTGTVLSPQQAEYFKDSKVRDGDGKLLKVYHGTGNDFTVFKTTLFGKTIKDSIGAHFGTENAAQARNKVKGNKTVMGAYLNIQKPLLKKDGSEMSETELNAYLKRIAKSLGVSDKEMGGGSSYAFVPESVGTLIKNELIKRGFDGVPYRNSWEDRGNTSYIAFSPSQIKSVDNLTPTTDPDIRYAERDPENSLPSARAILAGAFGNVAQTDAEKKRVDAYRKNADRYNRLEGELNNLLEKRRLLYVNKAPQEQKNEVRADINELKAKLDAADRVLLNLQMSQPLRDVVTREREKAYKEQLTKSQERQKEYREKVTQRDSRSKFIKSIEDGLNDLRKRLLTPDKKHYAPEILRKTINDLLQASDMAWTKADGTEVTSRRSKSWQEALGNLMTQMQNADAFAINHGEIASPDFVMDIDPDLASDIQDLIRQYDSVVRYRDMEPEGLAAFDSIVKRVRHAVTGANNLHDLEVKAAVSDVAEGTLSDQQEKKDKKLHGPGIERLDSFLNLDMADAFSFFERLGPRSRIILDSLYKRGFGKLVRNTEQAREFFQNLDKKYKDFGIANWSGKNAQVHTFEIQGGTVHLTTGQVMELYLLNKREQARGHIYGKGLSIEQIKSRKAGKAAMLWQKDPVRVIENDVNTILGVLTNEQRAAADEIAGFLNTVSSQWGNEVSMTLYGYLKFVDPNYYPIHSDTNFTLAQDPSKNEMINALLNLGSTKNVIKGANNPVIISDIFDTVTRHITDMANYNAFAVPLSNAMKWFNYKRESVDEKGNPRMASVRGSIERTMGKDANRYFINLLKGVNGIKGTNVSTGFIGLINSAVGKFKTAAVAGNIRVVLQQHASYARAASMINPAFMAAAYAKSPKRGMQMARKYSPIAMWKHLGYYDMQIGREMTDLIGGRDNPLRKVQEVSLKPAGLADDFTLGVLWNAIEIELGQTYEGDKRTEEFYKLVGDRLTDVIDRTQVVDTVFHRPQIMRDRDSLVKISTSFMAEPIKGYNMLVNAARSGDVGRIARTGVTFVATSILVAMAAGLSDALRDKEKEKGWEGFWDSYWSKVAGINGNFFESNFFDNTNPLNMIPFGKDIWGIAGGYTPSRPDLQAVQRLIKAGQGWLKVLDGTAGQVSAKLITDTISALSTATGIPASNIYRDVMSVIDTLNPRIIVGEGGVPAKLMYERFASALLAGDEDKALEYYNALIEAGTKSTTVRTGLLGQFKTSEILIAAAKAKKDKNYDDYEKLLKQAEGSGIPRDMAIKTVESLIDAEKPKEEAAPGVVVDALDEAFEQMEYSDKTYTYSNNDLIDSLVTYNGKNAKRIIDSMLKEGKKDSTIRSAITTFFKPQYIQTHKTSRAGAATMKANLLTAYSLIGYKREEVSKDIDDWLKPDKK